MPFVIDTNDPSAYGGASWKAGIEGFQQGYGFMQQMKSERERLAALRKQSQLADLRIEQVRTQLQLARDNRERDENLRRMNEYRLGEMINRQAAPDIAGTMAGAGVEALTGVRPTDHFSTKSRLGLEEGIDYVSLNTPEFRELFAGLDAEHQAQLLNQITQQAEDLKTDAERQKVLSYANHLLEQGVDIDMDQITQLVEADHETAFSMLESIKDQYRDRMARAGVIQRRVAEIDRRLEALGEYADPDTIEYYESLKQDMILDPDYNLANYPVDVLTGEKGVQELMKWSAGQGVEHGQAREKRQELHESRRPFGEVPFPESEEEGLQKRIPESGAAAPDKGLQSFGGLKDAEPGTLRNIGYAFRVANAILTGKWGLAEKSRKARAEQRATGWTPEKKSALLTAILDREHALKSEFGEDSPYIAPYMDHFITQELGLRMDQSLADALEKRRTGWSPKAEREKALEALMGEHEQQERTAEELENVLGSWPPQRKPKKSPQENPTDPDKDPGIRKIEDRNAATRRHLGGQ
jgi:hypothetical protein